MTLDPDLRELCFATGSGEYELFLRDMWDPDRLGYPGKVTSPSYACGSGDGGGVHHNSGVPNHAYARALSALARRNRGRIETILGDDASDDSIARLRSES